MTLGNSLPSGRDPDYQAFDDEQRKARRLLERMDRMEDYAEKLDHFAQVYTNVPERQIEHRRQLHANTYRQLVGVPPDKRHVLRRELEAFMRTGRGAVDSLVSSVRNRATEVLNDRHADDPFA